MDFLLVLLAVGGLVVAAAMLVLASRTARLERESDARVQELQALATGSVLFADDGVDEFRSAPPDSGAFADFDDEVLDVPVEVAASPSRRVTEQGFGFDRSAGAYPFVLTVPSGGAKVSGSFDMNHRSRS